MTNDPYFSSQWHLPKMAAPDAWAQSDGKGITVAVCDTGVNVNHVDLLGQTVPGYNTVSNNTETGDVHGHGTWVSGVVAAAVNNATGVASVAPGAKVMAMRITNDPAGYAYFSDMVECVDWAAKNGARVANISFGGVPGSASIADAASRFMRDYGGLVVVAAGNDGTDKLYPVYDSIYVAAATTSTDAKASFSNYGAAVDIAAPGQGIYTTDKGGGYASVSGTSFASPNTAAAAALVMAANPTLGPSDVMGVINQTAVPLTTPGLGAGRIDAYRAVQAAAVATPIDGTPPVASLTNPRTGVTVKDSLSVEVNATDNVRVKQVELLVDGKSVGLTETLPVSGTTGTYRFSWNSKTVSDGRHTVGAVAADEVGNRGTASAIEVQVTNSSDTTPPVVNITSPVNSSTVSGSVTMSASAIDNIAVTKVSIYLNGQLKCEGTKAASCSANLRKRTGPQTVTARAYDAAGNNASQTVQFSVSTSTKVSRAASTPKSWLSSWFGD